MVSGHVQGVGFRAFTNSRAGQRGVTGWVKNLSDGRVEAVIEGPADKVEGLLADIRLGPRGSRVDGVEVEEQTHTGEFSGFRVTY
ncbi:MAG TPA: acylphosphatase [Planctomycetota bacterium]|nr:acylphosphatase [Planctomycetota bacterium]